MKTALIITSIASVNEIMKIYAKKCRENGMEFILIGDRKSPPDFKLKDCHFVSMDEQKHLPFRLARLLPENHYCRKNIGYLMAKGYDVILETDDDNIPREDFWNKAVVDTCRRVNGSGWINVYRLFSDELIWPRGFPLELAKEIPVNNDKTSTFNIKIVQGLADENPDVDAVYRMVYHLPFNFKQAPPVVLFKNQWCPFNSQNTLWYKEAYPLLYLPSYCSFRMTDIWRSFIAQRILWTCDWQLAFHSADVYQERNPHNLSLDFKDEIPGYLNNDRIRLFLEELDLKTGVQQIEGNLLRCYEKLVEEKIFPQKEMQLVEAWLKDIRN